MSKIYCEDPSCTISFHEYNPKKARAYNRKQKRLAVLSKLMEDYATLKPCMIATLPDGSEKIFVGEPDPDNFPHARMSEAELNWVVERIDKDKCKKLKYEWRAPA